MLASDPGTIRQVVDQEGSLETYFQVGYSQNLQVDTQDIVVIDHDDPMGEHSHEIFDNEGQQLFSSDATPMNLLPVSVGPFGQPEALIEAWRISLKLLEGYEDQDVAYSMACQLITAKQDEWWCGEDPTQPVIAQIAELLLHLEAPDGDESWRYQQWQQVKELLLVQGSANLNE